MIFQVWHASFLPLILPHHLSPAPIFWQWFYEIWQHQYITQLSCETTVHSFATSKVKSVSLPSDIHKTVYLKSFMPVTTPYQFVNRILRYAKTMTQKALEEIQVLFFLKYTCLHRLRNNEPEMLKYIPFPPFLYNCYLQDRRNAQEILK